MFGFNKLRKENKSLKWDLNFWFDTAERLKQDADNNWEKHHQNEIRHYEHEIQHLSDRLDLALEHIKRTSTCKTCYGDIMKTPGGIPCKECGLIGYAPWEDKKH